VREDDRAVVERWVARLAGSVGEAVRRRRDSLLAELRETAVDPAQERRRLEGEIAASTRLVAEGEARLTKLRAEQESVVGPMIERLRQTLENARIAEAAAVLKAWSEQLRRKGGRDPSDMSHAQLDKALGALDILGEIRAKVAEAVHYLNEAEGRLVRAATDPSLEVVAAEIEAVKKELRKHDVSPEVVRAIEMFSEGEAKDYIARMLEPATAACRQLAQHAASGRPEDLLEER
jgi:hypothetical protein